MPRRYSFLRFRSGVDWKDVNPTLLVRMNNLAMYLGKVITIVSGARGLAGHPNMGASGSHHVPSNNPSGMGEAVDAYLGGKPLASVVKERTLKRYGLYSGNRPGFYQGKPDPEHIETLERRTGDKQGIVSTEVAASSGATGAPAQTTTAAAPQQQQPALETVAAPGGPPPPEASQAPIYAPGTVPADGFVGRDPAETWRLIASMPLASSDSRLFADRLSGGFDAGTG